MHILSFGTKIPSSRPPHRDGCSSRSSKGPMQKVVTACYAAYTNALSSLERGFQILVPMLSLDECVYLILLVPRLWVHYLSVHMRRVIAIELCRPSAPLASSSHRNSGVVVDITFPMPCSISHDSLVRATDELQPQHPVILETYRVNGALCGRQGAGNDADYTWFPRCADSSLAHVRPAMPATEGLSPCCHMASRSKRLIGFNRCSQQCNCSGTAS